MYGSQDVKDGSATEDYIANYYLCVCRGNTLNIEHTDTIYILPHANYKIVSIETNGRIGLGEIPIYYDDYQRMKQQNPEIHIFKGHFYGQNQLTRLPDNLDVSRVNNMSSMFEGAIQFNQELKWDVSHVTNMSYMFFNARSFGAHPRWEIPNGYNLDAMFAATYLTKNKKPKWLAMQLWKETHPEAYGRLQGTAPYWNEDRLPKIARPEQKSSVVATVDSKPEQKSSGATVDSEPDYTADWLWSDPRWNDEELDITKPVVWSTAVEPLQDDRPRDDEFRPSRPSMSEFRHPKPSRPSSSEFRPPRPRAAEFRPARPRASESRQ
jgi:hypothetical protein